MRCKLSGKAKLRRARAGAKLRRAVMRGKREAHRQRLDPRYVEAIASPRSQSAWHGRRTMWTSEASAQSRRRSSTAAPST